MTPSLALRQTAARVAVARRFGPAVPSRPIPLTQPPTLIESDYAGRLVAVVDQLREAVRHELSTWAWMHRADARAAGVRLRADDDSHPGAEARRRMKHARAVVGNEIAEQRMEGVAKEFGGRVAQHQRQQLAGQAEAALGTDVVVTDAGIGDLIAGFVHENVSLVKRLQGSALDELETILTRAAATGMRAEAIQEQIEERFGIAERHARLIAHDQVQSLNSRVTEARHRELGIQSYIWMETFAAKKPRPEHVARHNKPFRYDDPPADGHAGQAVMCHCLQQPNFDDIYAELDALGV